MGGFLLHYGTNRPVMTRRERVARTRARRGRVTEKEKRKGVDGEGGGAI